MFHIVLPVFGIMPCSLCIFLCFSHVCLLRRPVEAKPVQTQSISERDLGRARCLLWFGGQLWRQPQSTRVENIFLGFLFLSVQAQDLRPFQKLNKRLVQVVDNGLRLPICSIRLRFG